MSHWRKLAINLFVVLHLIVLAAWALPLDLSLRDSVNDVARPYLLWSGLWQGWDMFAPNPVTVNAYLDAEVLFADGSRTLWEFPRMEKLGLVDSFFKERFRKWAVDNVRLDASSAIWPDTARFIARQFADRPAPVREIRLSRHWATIPPPELADQPDSWSSYTFYVWKGE